MPPGPRLAGLPPDLRARLALPCCFTTSWSPAAPGRRSSCSRRRSGPSRNPRQRHVTLEVAESAFQYTRPLRDSARPSRRCPACGADVGEDPPVVAGPCLPLREPGRHGPLRRGAGRGYRGNRLGPAGPPGQGAAVARGQPGPPAAAAGDPADAAVALEGRFSPTRPTSSSACSTPSHGRPRPYRPAHRGPAADRIHLGHRPGDAQVRVPGIERHAAWLLALQPRPTATPPRRWLTSAGREGAPVPVPAVPPRVG